MYPCRVIYSKNNFARIILRFYYIEPRGGRISRRMRARLACCTPPSITIQRFSNRAASFSPTPMLDLPSSRPSVWIGGRPVTYHSRRIKIHRGSDDSGVKIHRNATAARVYIYACVSNGELERFDERAMFRRVWVDRLGRERDGSKRIRGKRKRW